MGEETARWYLGDSKKLLLLALILLAVVASCVPELSTTTARGTTGLWAMCHNGQ
jgi:hypothetical protein